MKPEPPPITQTRVEAFTASALGFLSRLFWDVLRLGLTGRSARLRRLLSEAEHAVERILFLHAVVRYGPLPAKRQRHAFAPRGFQIAHSRGTLFFKRSAVRARKAGACARVLALITALLRPERAIAYFYKRICNGLRARRLIAVAPPEQMLAPIARADVPAAIDTS